MKILIAVTAAALLLGGCAKKNDTPEAVKQGVIRDLAGKFDMSKMDVVVDSVSFRDKQANATVTFMEKGETASQGMTMRYGLEQHSDGQWYITSRASATDASGAEGASGALPAGHPALSGAPDEGSAEGGATPGITPGLIPAPGSQPNLPPGHPALSQ